MEKTVQKNSFISLYHLLPNWLINLQKREFTSPIIILEFNWLWFEIICQFSLYNYLRIIRRNRPTCSIGNIIGHFLREKNIILLIRVNKIHICHLIYTYFTHEFFVVLIWILLASNLNWRLEVQGIILHTTMSKWAKSVARKN